MIRKVFYFLAIIIMTLIASHTTAQTIKGDVRTHGGEPIDNVTIVMQSLDSTFIEAALTDSVGNFILHNSVPNYRLIFQHLLYTPLTKEYSDANVGTVTMDEASYAVDEVVIKGERPKVKVENGALVYNISDIAEKSSASTAYDALKRLPGVMEQDESIQLIGTHGVSIILNGRPSSMSEEQLMQLLRSTPIANVEKVEVLYSAPAKYRIRGAVINVVLKQNHSDSPKLRGEIGASYKQRHYGSTTDHLSLAYSNNRLYADAFYSYSYLKHRQDFDLISNHNLDDQIYHITQNDNGLMQGPKHQVRTSLNYKFTDNNVLDLSYTGAYNPNDKSRQTSTGNFSDALNIKHENDKMHNVAANFTTGFGLNAGADYTFYKNPSTQDFQDKSTDNSQHFITNSDQTINRINLYAGETHSLSKEWSINYGTNITLARDKSSQIYHSEDGKDMSNLDSHVKMDETTINFYGGADKAFNDKLSLSFSLAGEYYKLRDYKKWSVYPTFQLSYTPNESNIFQLSLSTDKDYPSYWTLQSSTTYINGYQKIIGNPNLRPSTEYDAQLTYILKSKYIVNLYYGRTQDYFVQAPYQSSKELSMIYQTLNFNYEQNGGISVIIPFSVGSVLNSRLTLDGMVSNERCDDFHDMSFNRTKLCGIVMLNNTVKLCSKPALSLEVNGTYVSPSLQAVYDLSHVWMLDSGLKLSFLGENAELKLQADDLLAKAIPTMNVNYKNQNFHMTPYFDNRYVSISFTYKFGGYKAKTYKEVDSSRFGQ